MKSWKKVLPALAALVIFLSACNFPTRGVGAISSQVPEFGKTIYPTIPVTGITAVVPMTGGAGAGQSPSAPAVTSQPGNVTATERSDGNFQPLVPNTGSARREILSLIDLLGWRVVGRDGAEIGTARDYIANTCEARLLYVVVEPAPALNFAAGRSLLIPYEVFRADRNNGLIDTAQGFLALNAAPADLASAPTVDLGALDLREPAWDESVQAYWRQNYSLTLSAACRLAAPAAPTATATATATRAVTSPTVRATARPSSVPATNTPIAPAPTETSVAPAPTETPLPPVVSTETGRSKPTKRPKGASLMLASYQQATPNAAQRIVYRVGLASSLLQTPVYDIRGNRIALIRDIAVLPQTGALLYFVVEQEGTGRRLLALPPGIVNLRYVEESGQLSPRLVLLVPVGALQDAPAYNPSVGNADPSWVAFWRRYIANP